MPLPPLSPTPNLSRLLAPRETIIYTAKLHPLFGWPWLLMAILLSLPAVLGYAWGWYLLPLAAALFFVYLLPFKHWECAITTQRLLLRFGRFGIIQNDIQPAHINHLQLKQNLLLSRLHAGHLTLHLMAGGDINPLRLLYLWHPLTFLEALETLTLRENKP